MTINVIKRSGRKEPLDISKIHKVVEWACEGITGVSVSEIELKSQIQFYDKIKSSDIHETMIKAASELITEDEPGYQYVASRLINYQLRKDVYGAFKPKHLLDHYNKIKDLGYYDSALSELYTDEEFNELNNYIDHERDYDIVYAGMEQLRGKYLVKNRVTGEIFETPQISFMLIAMVLFSGYKKDRIKWIKELYDAISTFDISLPTPIMAGVRTPTRQFSSCVLIETGDSLDSINATASAIVKYISQRAGIGIGAGSLRAEGSAIRGGEAVHTGVIPFWKYFESAVKSCSQGALRGGSATLYYPIWHREVENLLVLKNNKGTPETRITRLDYGVQFNKLMYERLQSDGNITLFSPSDVPGLYESFFNDQDKFKELYEKYEKNTKIKKKVVSAKELFESFMTERKETGRIYLMNVDHCNTHSSFIEKLVSIRMSNLCCEVTLPTAELEHIYDENGEISQCILGATNFGKIKKPSDFQKPCELLVRALDALIDYQEYPVLAGRNSTLNRRPLGIGLINYAYWLAKNGTNYSNTNLDLVHEYFEAWSYYLIKASADLAVEFGACPKSHETKYSQGILPIDTYKSNVDDLVSPVYRMPWQALREQLIKTGIRNSTLMAAMPSETSSQVSNATSGIDSPNGPLTVKASKDGSLRQVVPESIRLKNKYEYRWDQKSPIGMLKNAAVMQKFMDQAISTNTDYNPELYPDGDIPMSEMLEYLMLAYSWGIKTLYYLNTADGAGEIEDKELMPSEIEDEEDCLSCKI